MNETGIGFAGIDGLWWLPAVEPFDLPASLAGSLPAIGRALFHLYDAVSALYGQEAELTELLQAKVPAAIPRLLLPGRVELCRPDFQLLPDATAPGGLRPVATELEIAPSAQGFAHAMQLGYGLEPDLVTAMARHLGGRDLIIAGTYQWSQYLFEQLAFCRALAGLGVRARVLLDRPLTQIAGMVRRGELWRWPMPGLPGPPPRWETGLEARLARSGLAPFLWEDEQGWPEQVGQAVVFRFGYFDSFTPETLARFRRWHDHGATFLNPFQFFLDSKVLLAARQLPPVRRYLGAVDAGILPLLDRCLPPTWLLSPELRPSLLANKERWVIKYAGYDGGNRSWGGASLQLGLSHSRQGWQQVVDQALALPWPVVAQERVPSALADVDYANNAGEVQRLTRGRVRLRTFFLRSEGRLGKGTRVVACGSHVTIAGNTWQVAEATDTVQAPVRFVADAAEQEEA